MIYNPTEGLWRKFGNPPCSWPGFVVLIVGGGGAAVPGVTLLGQRQQWPGELVLCCAVSGEVGMCNTMAATPHIVTRLVTSA